MNIGVSDGDRLALDEKEMLRSTSDRPRRRAFRPPGYPDPPAGKAKLFSNRLSQARLPMTSIRLSMPQYLPFVNEFMTKR